MGLGSSNRVASRDTISKMSPRAQTHEIERLVSHHERHSLNLFFGLAAIAVGV